MKLSEMLYNLLVNVAGDTKTVDKVDFYANAITTLGITKRQIGGLVGSLVRKGLIVVTANDISII